MDELWHLFYIAIIIIQYKTLDFCKMCTKHKKEKKLWIKNKKIKDKMEAITRTFHPAEEYFDSFMDHFSENITKSGIIFKEDEKTWPEIAWYEDWDEILKEMLWNKICENIRLGISSSLWPDHKDNVDRHFYGYMNTLKKYFDKRECHEF